MPLTFFIIEIGFGPNLSLQIKPSVTHLSITWVKHSIVCLLMQGVNQL